MLPEPSTAAAFPLPLSEYPAAAASLIDTLSTRIAIEPFNLVATGIFVLAILHTFSAARFAKLAHAVQHATTSGPPVPVVHRVPASAPSCCTSSARSRWCSACGRWCSWSR